MGKQSLRISQKHEIIKLFSSKLLNFPERSSFGSLQLLGSNIMNLDVLFVKNQFPLNPFFVIQSGVINQELPTHGLDTRLGTPPISQKISNKKRGLRSQRLSSKDYNLQKKLKIKNGGSYLGFTNLTSTFNSAQMQWRWAGLAELISR